MKLYGALVLVLFWMVAPAVRADQAAAHKKTKTPVAAPAPLITIDPNEDPQKRLQERISDLEKKYQFLNVAGHNVVWSFNQCQALWNQRSVHMGDTITFRVVDYDTTRYTISIIGHNVKPNMTAFYSFANYYGNTQSITFTAPADGTGNTATADRAEDSKAVTYVSSLPILASGKEIFFSMQVVDRGMGTHSTPVTTVQDNFYKVWVDGNVESSFGLLGVFSPPGENGPSDVLDFSHYSFNQTPASYYGHFFLLSGHPTALSATAGLAGSGNLNLGLFLGASLFYGEDVRAVLSFGTSVWGGKTYPSLGFSIAGL